MSLDTKKPKAKTKKRPVKLTKLQAEAFEQLKKGDVYFQEGRKGGLCLKGRFSEAPIIDASNAVGKVTAYYGLVYKGFANEEDLWSGLTLTSNNPIAGTMGFRNFRTRRFTLSEKSLRRLRGEEAALMANLKRERKVDKEPDPRPWMCANPGCGTRIAKQGSYCSRCP